MTRKCPRDGAPIPDPGFYPVYSIFPDQYMEYSISAKSATEKFKCKRCGQEITDVHSIYTFVFMPSKIIFNYLPQHLTNDEIADFEKKQDEAMRKLGFEFIIKSSNNLKEVRNQALGIVLSLVNIPLLGKDGKIENYDVHLLSPKFNRDKAYHAALFLLSSRSQGFLAPTYLSGSFTIDGFWNELEDARCQQTGHTFAELCLNLTKSEADFDPLREIEEHFIPELFDDKTLSLIKAVYSKVLQSKFHYVVDSMLSAAALYGAADNPRSYDWALCVVSLFSQNAWPPRLRISQETLKKMLHEEQILHAMKEIGLLDDLRRIDTALYVIRELGYEDSFYSLFYERLKESLKVTPDKLGLSAEEFLENILSAAERRHANEDILGKSFSIISLIEDEKYKDRCFEWILEKFAQSNPEVIVQPAQKIAKHNTVNGNPSKALDIILKAQSKIDFNSLEPNSKTALLTEIGNAYRAKFDYQSSLSAYRKIISIIGKDLSIENVRVNEMNIARVLRDMGHISDAEKIFLAALPYTKGREKFDCLFALGLLYQRIGEFQKAQRFLDEAKSFIKYHRLDDQHVRFYRALVENQRKLGLEPDFELLLKGLNNKDIPARTQFLIIGALGSSVYPIDEDLDSEANRKLLELLDTFIEDLNLLEIARTDPEMAVNWCGALINTGKYDLASSILDILLNQQDIHPLILIYSATKAAELSSKKGDWKKAISYIVKANLEMMSLVKKSGLAGSSVDITDTMMSVRRLARYIYQVPDQPEVTELLSALADLQCSLSLSTDLASDYLPLFHGTNTKLEILWHESIQRVILEPIQILQFMDAGEYQIPMLTLLKDGRISVKRSNAISSDILFNCGSKVTRRLWNWPIVSSRDPLENYEPYVLLKEQFLSMANVLGINKDVTLLITPSSVVLGVPFHHIFFNQPIAYIPSISISLALFSSATKRSIYPSTVGEIVCWKFNEDLELIGNMQDGSKGLREICNRIPLDYESITGTAATKSNVKKLIKKASWIKLNCHGLGSYKVGSKKFALLLSDGEQNPPDPNHLITEEDAQPFLLYWDELSGIRGSCSIVFSTACTTGSASATLGGEQIGMVRAFFRTGVLSYVAPLWPVWGKIAQIFINAVIERSIANPNLPLAIHVRDVKHELQGSFPIWMLSGFILDGYPGQVSKEVN